MIKRKLTGLLIILLVMLLLTSACTKKKNLTGDNWSNLRPITAIDTSFVMGYSYLHDGKLAGTETSLIAGTEDGITSMAVMRFTNLPEPDTMAVIWQPTLKLVTTRRSALSRAPIELSFYKLTQNWAADSTSDILETNISSTSFANYTVMQDTISILGDTLTIPISTDVIHNWQTDGISGFSIVAKVTNAGWLEFKSFETGKGPLLNFKYQLTGATDTLEYSQRSSNDSYKVTGTQTNISANTWKLKNLLPERMFFRFGLPGSIFKDLNNEVLDAADVKKMTINKAELVLFVKDNPYYKNAVCYFYPYHVRIDTLMSPTVLTDGNLETISRSYTTATKVSGDSVKIDITAIVQAYTSGDKPKNGIVVRSVQEMQNFGNLEFWHYGNAPAGKKPYVRVTYSPPFLEDK